MRRIALAAVAVIAFAGCVRDGVKCEITANVGTPDMMCYLVPEGEVDNYYAKSKTDAKGTARFKVRFKQPVCAGLSDGLSQIAGPFFVEDGSVVLDRFAQNPKVFIAHGTPSNDAYNTYRMQLMSLDTKYDTVRFFKGDSLSRHMSVEFDSLGTAVEAANYDNIFGLYLFTHEKIFTLSPREADSVSKKFSRAMQRHPYMQAALRKRAAEAKK